MFGFAPAIPKRPFNADQTVGGVDFDDSEDRVRMSILPASAAQVTLAGWFLYDGSHSGGGTYNCVCAVEDDPGHSGEYNEVTIEAGNLVFYDQGPSGSGRMVMSLGTVPLNTWCFGGYTVDPSNNNATMFMGQHGGNLSYATALIYPCSTVGVASFGRSVYTVEYLGGALSNWIAADRYRTRGYLEAQFRSVPPVSNDGILGWWKMQNVATLLTDYSSRGNTLTELGTATRANVTGPTIGG